MASKVFDYDVAISYAGPQRELAEKLAEQVGEAGFRVFFDRYYAADLWGRDLAVYFDEVFRKQSRYCVIFASKEYVERMWTTHERRSAIARSIEEKGNEYILPIMVETVEIPGLPTTIGYVSTADYSIDNIAEMLKAKLSGKPVAPRPLSSRSGLSDHAESVLRAMLRHTGGRYPHCLWFKESSLRLSVPESDVVIEGVDARYVLAELVKHGYVEYHRGALYCLTLEGRNAAKSLG